MITLDFSSNFLHLSGGFKSLHLHSSVDPTNSLSLSSFYLFNIIITLLFLFFWFFQNYKSKSIIYKTTAGISEEDI